MKNLTHERREELRKPPSGLDGWLHGGSVSMTRGELMSLLAASELLDAALAENRAWRLQDRGLCENWAAIYCVRDGLQHVPITRRVVDAMEATNTTAARVGWEMEGA